MFIKIPLSFISKLKSAKFYTHIDGKEFYIVSHCLQESMCDLLDKEGKESLEVAVCREAAGKSPRAFWAFRRLGFLQVFHHLLCLSFFFFFFFFHFWLKIWAPTPTCFPLTFRYFLQVHQKKWSEAVHNLQQAIRGYPTSADLWEVCTLFS